MCVESFERFNGRRSGAGKDVAILSHGFGTDQTAWNALRPWCEARFDVISFDLAGCGPHGAQTYDFERHGALFGYADDLIDILDELDVRDCTYIGHSMSGMIGAAAAVARPDLFERLVIIGASPRYLDDDGYTGGFRPQDLDQLFDSMRANYQAWIAGFAPMVVGVEDSAVAAEPILVDGERIAVSVSVGGAIGEALPGGDQKLLEALISRADEALYEAKTSGRNRVRMAELQPDLVAP